MNIHQHQIVNKRKRDTKKKKRDAAVPMVNPPKKKGQGCIGELSFGIKSKVFMRCKVFGKKKEMKNKITCVYNYCVLKYFVYI